jgi:hypothetical protein
VVHPPPPPPSCLKSIASYRDLFYISDRDNLYDGDDFFDKSVLLQPFNRRAYLTNVTFTGEDFYRYAWILSQSEERWYNMPTASILAEMRRYGLKKRSSVKNPRPARMDNPIIVAGSVLSLDEYMEETVEKSCWGDCGLLHPDDTAGEHGKKKWACERCHEKRVQLHRDVGWVYLSVVRTDSSKESLGMGMFMLRRNGSQEQAAAMAFYDAAFMGWSTVFCCAIRGDVELTGWKGRVKCIHSPVCSVLAPEDGVLRVFL